jgi:outer membrane receptor protein involved in Fe transport
MSRSKDRGLKRAPSLAAAISLTLAAAQAQAQQPPTERTLDEVVVTGSYIKRTTFDAPSPTEVIDSTAIAESGAPTLGQFIRDLTFTQNTDTVANVLGTQDGQQDSNSANFNIRGLGVGSTLTLFDSRRIVSPGSVGSVVPELAIERFEVVLDGGAALYGTDAVAGVVNVIPVKRYNGIKVRAYYNQAEDHGFDHQKYSILAGHTFFDALDVVFAADFAKKSALYRVERPEYLRADNDTSPSGNPGTYTNLGTSTTYRDPDCGQFGQELNDHGAPGSFPSGIPSGATTCNFEYGKFHDYARPSKEFNTFLSTVYALNDKINIEFQANADFRTSTLITSPSTALQGNNLLLRVPVNNPGNQTGQILRMGSATGAGWRPFTGYGTLPSHFDHRGATNADYNYDTDRYKLGLTYKFGDTSWSGETWVSTQTTRTEIEGYALYFDRMQAALNGLGGPNGNEFWNPFGSSDPRSANYTTARANSQQVVDWMWGAEPFESERERLQFVESFVTGELFDLPGGPLAMAFGAQVRELTRREQSAPAELAQNDYNVYIGDDPDGTLITENQVRAVFAELSIPIIDQLTMQIAARREEFVDLDLEATKPKVAIRYEPFSRLAFRASYGEGFLAPTPNQILVQSSADCAEVFAGTDPFYPGAPAVSIIGSASCFNGNPNLKPEDSTIYNFGFSWEIIDDLEISADYQKIKYVDRIITLTSADVLLRDFTNFLAANGLTTATYNRTTHAALRDAWFASGMDPAIARAAPVGGVNAVASVQRTSENLSSNEVDVFDFRVKYAFGFESLGDFNTQIASTYYESYKYTGFNGRTVDAVGLQNSDTNLAPPLPQWKHTLRVAWGLGNHGAALSTKYQDGVRFDTAGITPGWPRPQRIGSYTTVDVRYGYKFENLWKGDLDFAIGSTNVLDERPDPLPVLGGLETRLGDPFGRQFYAEISYAYK